MKENFDSQFNEFSKKREKTEKEMRDGGMDEAEI